MSTDQAMAAFEKIVEAFPVLRGQMLHGMPMIIHDAYAETLSERDRIAKRLEQFAHDMTETDTHIRESARRVLGDYVDGDSTCVPPVEEIVDLLVKRVEELRRLLSGARSLIVNEQPGWCELEDHINAIDASLKEQP